MQRQSFGISTNWMDSVQTGDLLFFNGKNFPSHLIQWSGPSPWSHVGMIIRLMDRVCLWESVNDAVHTRALSLPTVLPVTTTTTTTTPTAINMAEPYALYEAESYRTGVRLVDLRERLQALPTHERLGLARIQSLLLHGGRPQFQDCIEQALWCYNGRPYEHDWWTLIKSWADCCDDRGGCTFNQEDLTAFFCSELVAQTLHDAGCIQWTGQREGAGSSGEVTVADIARLSDSTHPLHYRPRARLIYSVVQDVIY
jgi:hypothetical protein